jgi:hypothetical protein
VLDVVEKNHNMRIDVPYVKKMTEYKQYEYAKKEKKIIDVLDVEDH